METATIAIKSVTAGKSGVLVVSDGVQRWTTFDPEWAKHVGETLKDVPVEIKLRKGGGFYQNLGEFPKKVVAVPRNEQPMPALGNGQDKFAILNAKLDRVLEELTRIGRHFAP